MKKLLLLSIVLFSIFSVNAQYYRNNERIPIQSHYYGNYRIQPEPSRVKINILPILGAIITTAIISNQLNDYDNYESNSRNLRRQRYYQNQLDIERFEMIERQNEMLERNHYRRERGFLGIFHRRHHRY